MPTTVLATRDGRFDTTDLAALGALKARLAGGGSNVLLHLHGGLVPEAAGRAIATRLSGKPPAGLGLDEAYEKVFVVWRTGPFETLGANWTDLFENDRLYKVLLTRLLKFVAPKLKLPAGAGRSAADAHPLSLEDIEAALAARPAGDPFAKVDELIERGGPAGRGPEVQSQADVDIEGEFEITLTLDDELPQVANDIAAALSTDPATGVRSSLVTGDPVEGERTISRLSREMQANLKGLAPVTARARVAFTAAGVLSFLVQHGAAIAVRVIRRFRDKRDHGFYPTVVEELARELYGDLVGATIWGMMKKDATDPFGRGAEGAGAALIDALTATPPVRLTITAHSAGAIWATALMQAMAKLDKPPRIDLVLLAPAVRMDAFAEALKACEANVGRCRMFTMSDALERTDAVLGHDKGYIYPMSLLYLVSALFEEDGKSAAFVDAPLLGMQRFLAPDPAWLKDPAQVDAVRRVQAFLAKHDVVYSKQDGPPGFSSRSDSHGGFDSEEYTLASAAVFLG